MPLPLQARLLRVLQERSVTPLGASRSIAVDVELVCATNHNLRQRIADGLFREDLYYRLNGLVVKLPPLRQRHDLEALAHAILAAETGNGRQRLSDEVLRLFKRHSWPGNLRQLASLLRTAAIMAGDELDIAVHHLPDDFLDELDPMETPDTKPAAASAGPGPAARLDDLELAAIMKTLDAHGGNMSATARALGISRNTLYRKLPHLK